MIVVKLMGGTGNQMFQYAFGRRLAETMGCPLKLDLSFLESDQHDELYVKRDYSLDIFGIHSEFYDYQNGEEVSLIPVQERTFRYDPECIPQHPNVLLDGYWQSPKYFEPIEATIRETFDLSGQPGIDPSLCARFASPCSVCINVRRGDFVSNERSRSFHGVLGLEYIQAGIHLVTNAIPHPEFFVFSDDIDWCKDNIKLCYPVQFIGHEHAGDRYSRYLYYMSCFSNFIIPNSSFAWWSVWLSASMEKKQLVVAPKRWFLDPGYCFDDLIPSHWHRL